MSHPEEEHEGTVVVHGVLTHTQLSTTWNADRSLHPQSEDCASRSLGVGGAAGPGRESLTAVALDVSP